MVRALAWAIIALVAGVGGCEASRSAAKHGPDPARASAAEHLPLASKPLRFRRPGAAGAGEPAPVLKTLQLELSRALGELSQQQTAPYYLCYQVVASQTASIEASEGLLVDTSEIATRTLDVDVRVGSHQLDNTHGDVAEPYLGTVLLPLDDDPLALRVPIWLATESAYRAALEELIQVRAAKEVGAAESDDSPDFSREEPVRFVERPVSVSWNRTAWHETVKQLSALFRRHPEIERSYVKLHVSSSTRYFTSSEQTLIQTGQTHAWMAYGAELTADDGMVLSRNEEAFAHALSGLPDQAELKRRIEALIDELLALRKAPLGEPYVGPVLLDGLAAAVLFHEVLGHRVEGHRQRQEWEGQTFAKKIGERIMPRGFLVYDDPGIGAINGIDLNGFYFIDSEGVRARPVTLVEDGIFRGFLMSRTPIRGFSHSNGHGRKQPGFRAVARQGNLIVDPAQVTTRRALRQALIAQVKRRGLPFGLRVSRVTGGFTQTTTGDPQAFQLEPVLVYRVYPDGREQLIRGVSIEGTPLSILASVVAAANDFAVFNGLCGAESGQVPVAAVSPSVLVSEAEVTRVSKAMERPPLLPPPELGSRQEGR